SGAAAASSRLAHNIVRARVMGRSPCFSQAASNAGAGGLSNHWTAARKLQFTVRLGGLDRFRPLLDLAPDKRLQVGGASGALARPRSPGSPAAAPRPPACQPTVEAALLSFCTTATPVSPPCARLGPYLIRTEVFFRTPSHADLVLRLPFRSESSREVAEQTHQTSDSFRCRLNAASVEDRTVYVQYSAKAEVFAFPAYALSQAHSIHLHSLSCIRR